MLHLVGEFRRLAVARADNGTRDEGRLALVDHAHVEIGEVHEDQPVMHLSVVEPALPLHVQNHVVPVIFDRPVHGADRVATGHAIGADAVVELEFHHGGLQARVVFRGDRPFEIAHRDQAVPSATTAGPLLPGPRLPACTVGP
jgi:hypothetical protein